MLLERFESPLDKPPPTAEPYSQYNRPPESYYQPHYAHPQQQPYPSYAGIPYRPQAAEPTYHYQSGAFAPPPHPPQFAATYQYAQAGMLPAYTQQPPRTYTEAQPTLLYGSSPISPVRQVPHPATSSYSPHPYGTPYNEPVDRPAGVPRHAPALPMQTYLPPAPSLYETSVQPRQYTQPGQPVQPTIPPQYGSAQIGLAPGMGLEQYAMGGAAEYPPARYGGHGYYEEGDDGEQ